MACNGLKLIKIVMDVNVLARFGILWFECVFSKVCINALCTYSRCSALLLPLFTSAGFEAASCFQWIDESLKKSLVQSLVQYNNLTSNNTASNWALLINSYCNSSIKSRCLTVHYSCSINKCNAPVSWYIISLKHLSIQLVSLYPTAFSKPQNFINKQQ